MVRSVAHNHENGIQSSWLFESVTRHKKRLSSAKAADDMRTEDGYPGEKGVNRSM